MARQMFRLGCIVILKKIEGLEEPVQSVAQPQLSFLPSFPPMSSLAILPNDCLNNIASYVSTISYTHTSAPNTDLMSDLRTLNASIINERIMTAVSDFKSDYYYLSFHGIHKTNCKSVILGRSNNLLDCLLVKHSLTSEKLYDMMTRTENLKSAGMSGTFSLFELRNYLFRMIRHKIIYNMYRVLRNIEESRKPATVSNSGCIQCDAALPLWWPSAKNHGRKERNLWWKQSMGFYRIGFCSADCITDFNNAQRSDCKIEEPDNGIMSPKTRYTCKYRHCKCEILWTDLENRGCRTFCSDNCEERQIEDEYEDDLMYAKYDRYLDKW
jgi:hypothetical protein